MKFGHGGPELWRYGGQQLSAAACEAQGSAFLHAFLAKDALIAAIASRASDGRCWLYPDLDSWHPGFDAAAAAPDDL